MHSPASSLDAALQGCGCRVTKRDFDWSFDFGDRLNIAVSVPWRIVTSKGIAHGDKDDGQRFGLPEPVDGEVRTNGLLHGQKVVGVELNPQTGDLRLVFDGGTHLDFFNNSSGYEAWLASVPADGKKLTIIALGGGGLITH